MNSNIIKQFEKLRKRPAEFRKVPLFVIIVLLLCFGYAHQSYSSVLEVNLGKVNISNQEKFSAELFPFEIAPFRDNVFSVGIIPYKVAQIEKAHLEVHSICTNVALNCYPLKFVLSKEGPNRDLMMADLGLFSKYEFAYSLGKDTSEHPQPQLFVHNFEIGIKFDFLAYVMPMFKCGYRWSFLNDSTIANKNPSCFFVTATLAVLSAKEFSGFTDKRHKKIVAEAENSGNCEFLKGVACDYKESKTLRINAVDALGRVKSDCSMRNLRDIILCANDEKICSTAVSKINNDSMLLDIALHSTSDNVSSKAISQLHNQMLLYDQIAATNDNTMKRRLINSITDQKLLYQIYVDMSSESEKEALAARITDQKYLIECIQSAQYWHLKYYLLQRLSEASLTYLSEEARDSSVLIASKALVNRITWKDAFSTYETGIVLSAAAMVERSKPNNEIIIEQCHHYIRLGDESRLGELIKLLKDYGDKSLAEDYMNCGQSDLGSAGKSWCYSHGYNVGAGNGSNRATWGSGK
jgi:hypothetical protein